MDPAHNLVGDLWGGDGLLFPPAFLLGSRAPHWSSPRSRRPKTQVKAVFREQRRTMRRSMTRRVKVSDGAKVHLGEACGGRYMSEEKVSQEEAL